MTDIEKDAARYRWLKSRSNLEMRSYPANYMKITNDKGDSFYASHYLAEGNTSHASLDCLDATIDLAMMVASERGA